MSASYTYWEEPSGFWIGYWNDYPDYTTQGRSFEELEKMLVSLRADITAMVEDGTIPATNKTVRELAFA